MPTVCQEISSLVVSKVATFSLSWGSWTGFDFELVNAINVDRHTGWLKLESISGAEFCVCFGSLCWLNSPDESSLFVTFCCGENASWHYECWLSLCTDDGACSSSLERGGGYRLTFWIIKDLPFDSGPLCLSSFFVLKNMDLWPLKT